MIKIELHSGSCFQSDPFSLFRMLFGAIEIFNFLSAATFMANKGSVVDMSWFYQ